MKRASKKGKTPAHLSCMTQYTRMQMEGKEPSRNMTNYKALEQPMRRKRWEARQAEKK